MTTYRVTYEHGKGKTSTRTIKASGYMQDHRFFEFFRDEDENVRRVFLIIAEERIVSVEMIGEADAAEDEAPS